MTPPIDRRTLLAGTLASATLATPAMAQSFPLPQGFERFPIWPGKAPGGERVTVQEVESLRRPDSGPDDGVFAHVVTPTLTLLRPTKPNGAAILLIPRPLASIFSSDSEVLDKFVEVRLPHATAM